MRRHVTAAIQSRKESLSTSSRITREGPSVSLVRILVLGVPLKSLPVQRELAARITSSGSNNPFGKVTSSLCFPACTSGILALARGAWSWMQEVGTGGGFMVEQLPPLAPSSPEPALAPLLCFSYRKSNSLWVFLKHCSQSQLATFYFGPYSVSHPFWWPRAAWQRFGNSLRNAAGIAHTTGCGRRGELGCP